MFTRLHLKQEPHHDSARPDDWEGRNREDEGILGSMTVTCKSTVMQTLWAL